MPADTSFVDRVLCVGLRSACYGTSIQDSEQTEFLLTRNDASRGSMAAKKSRLAKGVAPIKKLIGATRTEFNKATLPGLARGDRIILATELPKLRTVVGRARTALDDMVGELIANFDVHIEEDRRQQGKAWKRSDYPTDPAFLRGEFDLRLTVSDMPRGEFARVVGVARVDESALAEQFREQLVEVGETARRTVLTEYLGMIRHVVDVMRDPDRSKFYESTFENLRAFAARVPALNITNDPSIASLNAEVMSRLGHLQMEIVKSSSLRKDEVAEAAESILRNYTLGGARRIAI